MSYTWWPLEQCHQDGSPPLHCHHLDTVRANEWRCLKKDIPELWVCVSSSHLNAAGAWSSNARVLQVKGPGGVSCLLEECLFAVAGLRACWEMGRYCTLASHPLEQGLPG